MHSSRLRHNVAQATLRMLSRIPTSLSALCCPSLVHVPLRTVTSVYATKLRSLPAPESAASSVQDHRATKPTSQGGAFAALGVAPELDALLAAAGITAPTPTQALAIPALALSSPVPEARAAAAAAIAAAPSTPATTAPDRVVGIPSGDGAIGAQTGTGKTLSYLLPLLSSLIHLERSTGTGAASHRPRALVIVPSRELALQVAAVAKSLCHAQGARFKVAAALGGEAAATQKRGLAGQDSRRAEHLWRRLAAQWRPAMTERARARVRQLRAEGVPRPEARRQGYAEAKEAFAAVAAAVRAGTTTFEKEFGPDQSSAAAAAAEARAASEGKAAAEAEQANAVAAAAKARAEEDEIPVADISPRQRSSNSKAGLGGDADALAEEEEEAELEGAMADALRAEGWGAEGEDAAEEVGAEVEASSQRSSSISSTGNDSGNGYVRASLVQQLGQLRNVDVLVGTPGRLLALLKDGSLLLSDVTEVVVDEADFLLHPRSGFAEELAHLLHPLRRRAEDAYLRAHGSRPHCFGLSASALASGAAFEEEPAAVARAAAAADRLASHVMSSPAPSRLPPRFVWAGASLGGAFQALVHQFFPLYAEKPPRALAALETKGNLCLPPRLRLSWVRTGGRDKLEILTELLSGDKFAAHAADSANGAAAEAEAARAGRHDWDGDKDQNEWVTDGDEADADVEDDDAASAAAAARAARLRSQNLLRHSVPAAGSYHVYPSPVLVFCNTVSSARAAQHALAEAGVSVAGVHGDVPPRLRRQAWSDFLSRRVAVLVATDLAGRGVDTRFLSKAINFDMPYSPVDFLHRAGRTARAADAGHVITLLAKGDEVLARAIDKAHAEGRPITRLSADAEAYRPDIAPALRPLASRLGIPRAEVERARGRQRAEREAAGAERRARGRDKRAEERKINAMVRAHWDTDARGRRSTPKQAGKEAARTAHKHMRRGASLAEAEGGPEQMTPAAKRRAIESVLSRARAREREADLRKHGEAEAEKRAEAAGRVPKTAKDRARVVDEIIASERGRRDRGRRRRAGEAAREEVRDRRGHAESSASMRKAERDAEWRARRGGSQ